VLSFLKSVKPDKTATNPMKKITPNQIKRKEKPVINMLMIAKTTAISIKMVPKNLTVTDKSKFMYSLEEEIL
jgi:hypothetical protein